MKKRLFLLFAILIILSACSSKRLIFNDPGFTHSGWASKKIGVLPVLILPTTYSELKEEVINRKAEEVLGKRKLSHAKLISPVIIEEEMNVAGVMDDYVRISGLYKKLDSWQKRKDFVLGSEDIRKIGKKLGLDRVVVLKIIRKLSSSEEDDKGREKTEYLSLTQMQIYDSADGSLLYKYTTFGEYKYVEHRSFFSIVTGPLHINFDYNGKYYQRAFENGLHRCLIRFNERFTGECVSGNCIDGRGVFSVYDTGSGMNINTEQRYEGPFLDNYAHGDGTYYYTRNGIIVKYEGVWEKGELKKKKTFYYLKEGKWTVITKSELKKMF